MVNFLDTTDEGSLDPTLSARIWNRFFGLGRYISKGENPERAKQIISEFREGLLAVASDMKKGAIGYSAKPGREEIFNVAAKHFYGERVPQGVTFQELASKVESMAEDYKNIDEMPRAKIIEIHGIWLEIYRETSAREWDNSRRFLVA